MDSESIFDKLHIDRLPNELLIQIASHLDIPPPSKVKFAHEPSDSLTCANETPLKILSLVSWRWRKLVLPILFHYTRIPLDDTPQWVPIDARLIENMQSQLTTLSNHEMQIFQRMRSKFKSSSMFAFDESFDELLINLCRIQDGDSFLKSVPNILWFPHLHPRFASFHSFVAQNSLSHHIQSLVLYSKKDYELLHVSTADAPLSRAVSDLWTTLFAHFNPARLVVAAPPTTLAALLDTQLLSPDTWAFDMKTHYLELTQPTHPVTHSSSTCRPWRTTLLHHKPWTSLSYNEGSSITAYSTYEYHLKQSPKILYLLLLRLAKECAPCCNIRSFSFVGVFPFSTNLSTLIRALGKIPTLRDVAFRLANGPENALLLDEKKRLGRAQLADLWLEWHEGYKVVCGFLEGYEWGEVARFRSGDCEVSGVLEGEVRKFVCGVEDGQWREEGMGVWVRGGEGNAQGEGVREIGMEGVDA